MWVMPRITSLSVIMWFPNNCCIELQKFCITVHWKFKENSREVLVDFFKNNLGIDDAESIELQRVHRIGKYDSEQTKPRQMIARFLRYPEREEVFSKAGRLKGTGLGISADLPKSIVEARKKLISKFKAAKKDGKTAFFSRAEPDKLYINGVLISP